MKKLLKQELKSYTPEWNAKCSIITNLIIMISSFSIGITMLYFSKRFSMIEIKYTSCLNNLPNFERFKRICTFPLQIDKRMEGPVFIYYKLQNFYLNHRHLVESKSWEELRGEEVYTKNNCKNSYLMSEMFPRNSPFYTNQWGHNFAENNVSSPCGLWARSFFNDTYNLTFANGTRININEYDISNQYLKENFFKRRNDYKNKQWIDVENEHFINWMNIETSHNFKKIWGKINFDLEPGNYTLSVKYNYDIKKYNADKYVCISNSNRFGINNLFGYFFIAIGIYLVVIILTLINSNGIDIQLYKDIFVFVMNE